MKNSKKKMALLMAGVLSISALAACGTDKGGNAPANNGQKDTVVPAIKIVKGPIDPDSMPSAEDLQYVTDKTGVKPTIETFPWNEYTQKVQTLIAAGDLPDLLRPNGQGGNIDQIMIKQGAALALDDLLPKYAPNMWKSMPEEAWAKVRAAAPDGKIYYIPKYDLFPRLGLMIRKDWLDRVGMKAPTTKEELVEVLKAFRDKDANGNGIMDDEIPTSGREGGRWMDGLFSMHGVAMYEGFPDWNLVDGKLVYSAVTPNMKESLQFLAQLYKEKLLDNETFLNKNDIWKAKISNDRVGMWFHIPNEAAPVFENIKSKNPQGEVIAISIPKVDGYEGFISQKAMGFVDYMIPKSAEKNAPNVLKYLDWWYTEEGQNFQIHGQAGATDTLEKQKSREFALTGLSMWDIAFRTKLVEANAGAYGDQIKSMWEASSPSQKLLPADGMPNSIYEGFADIGTHKIYQEYSAKIILGEWPIEKFDEFVTLWKKSGGEEVTKRANEWYQAIQKK
jgi:putative aldouronate transport system substrate-binding protein